MRIQIEELSELPPNPISSDFKLMEPKTIDLKDIHVLCVFGLSTNVFEKVQFWLSQEHTHKLIFVEDQPDVCSVFFQDSEAKKLLENPQIEFHLFDEHQREKIANELAWDAVFLNLKTLELRPSSSGKRFLQDLEYRHLGVFLIASDNCDFGVSAMENVYANFQSRSSFLKADATQSCFQIPAIICGAGPSFEKNAKTIRSMDNQALIFAGGAALNVLNQNNIRPHFAANVDKMADPSIFKEANCWEVPFFFQAHMQKKNFSMIHAPEILVSDSGGYLLERWLHEELDLGNTPENIGWTVTTFLAKLAVDMGCNPIIFVGMDLSYDQAPYSPGGPKNKEADVRMQNFKGDSVWTQKDWIVAAHWVKKFAKENTNTEFFNVTDMGLDLSPIPHVSIKDIEKLLYGKSYDLSGYVHHAVSEMSIKHIESKLKLKLREIRESLSRSQKLLEKILESIEIGHASNQLEVPSDTLLKKELIYGKLLWPLWQIWQHVIKRGIDRQSNITPETQMQIHRFVFFKQVIDQHIEVAHG